jgi:hypothetical protein
MLNLHKLFLNAGHPDSFDEVIDPTKAQRETLVNAKNLIRERLSDRLAQASIVVLGMDHMVRPRFRTQGSWTYKTCVQGAHRPPQEMDWDFGVYLPVVVWNEQRAPKVVAKTYFNLVETALGELCYEEGWHLDQSNEKCVRVRITSWAHIDVPLYAAPEAEFGKIMERASARLAKRALRESVALDEAIDFGEMPEQFWEEMSCIHLATRLGEWWPSDPEAVARWFNDRIEEMGEHGEQMRRVCRYLKAWRDYQWQTGGPSSVLIMIIVAAAFEPAPRRDDLAVERAAKRLSECLKGEVRERGIDEGAENFNRLDEFGRRQASARAAELVKQLHDARHLGPGLRGLAIEKLQAVLGSRIADDMELVVPDSSVDRVIREPARVVVPPVVGSTHAG